MKLTYFLYFLVAAGLLLLFLLKGFTIIGASLASLGVILLIIVIEHLIVDYLENKNKK